MKSLTGSEFEWLRLSLVAGLGEGCRRSKMKLADRAQGRSGGRVRNCWRRWPRPAAVVLDRRRRPTSERELALAVVVFAPWDVARPALEALLDPRQSQASALAAVRTAAGTGRPEAAELLLAGWSGYSPAIRGEVVDALLTRVEYLNALFDAIERGVVPARTSPRRGGPCS